MNLTAAFLVRNGSFNAKAYVTFQNNTIYLLLTFDWVVNTADAMLLLLMYVPEQQIYLHRFQNPAKMFMKQTLTR